MIPRWIPEGALTWTLKSINKIDSPQGVRVPKMKPQGIQNESWGVKITHFSRSPVSHCLLSEGSAAGGEAIKYIRNKYAQIPTLHHHPLRKQTTNRLHMDFDGLINQPTCQPTSQPSRPTHHRAHQPTHTPATQGGGGRVLLTEEKCSNWGGSVM